MKIIFGVLIYEALGVMWWLIFVRRKNKSLLQNYYQNFKFSFAIGTGNPKNEQALAKAIAEGLISEETIEDVLFISAIIDTLIFWPISLFIVNPLIWIFSKLKK